MWYIYDVIPSHAVVAKLTLKQFLVCNILIGNNLDMHIYFSPLHCNMFTIILVGKHSWLEYYGTLNLSIGFPKPQTTTKPLVSLLFP
jgi:hypothetical protein